MPTATAARVHEKYQCMMIFGLTDHLASLMLLLQLRQRAKTLQKKIAKSGAWAASANKGSQRLASYQVYRVIN